MIVGFTGKSGVGKSTFAKKYARSCNIVTQNFKQSGEDSRFCRKKEPTRGSIKKQPLCSCPREVSAKQQRYYSTSIASLICSYLIISTPSLVG